MTYEIMLDHIAEEAGGFDVRFIATARIDEWAERKIPSRKERYILLAAEMRKAAAYVEAEAAKFDSPFGRPTCLEGPDCYGERWHQLYAENTLLREVAMAAQDDVTGLRDDYSAQPVKDALARLEAAGVVL